MTAGWKAPLKRAVRTAVFSFAAVFGLSLIGWLNDVVQWANDTDAANVFPDPAVLVKAAVSAAAGAASGLVSFVVNLAEDLKGGTTLFGAKTQRND